MLKNLEAELSASQSSIPRSDWNTLINSIHSIIHSPIFFFAPLKPIPRSCIYMDSVFAFVGCEKSSHLNGSQFVKITQNVRVDVGAFILKLKYTHRTTYAFIMWRGIYVRIAHWRQISTANFCNASFWNERRHREFSVDGNNKTRSRWKMFRIHAQYGVKFAEMLFGPTEMSIVKRVALTKNAFSSLPIVSIQFSIIHLWKKCRVAFTQSSWIIAWSWIYHWLSLSINRSRFSG